MQNEEPLDDRRDGQRSSFEGGGTEGRWGGVDDEWDAALAAARVGDASRIVGYVARRARYPLDLVDTMLTGPQDEDAALLCRAADLPWQTFEGILSWRSRRFGRGPGTFGSAIRLYRDTSVDTARRAIALANEVGHGEDAAPTYRTNGHANGHNGHPVNGKPHAVNGANAPIHLGEAPHVPSGD